MIKTLSKPLSKQIQHQMSKSPRGERILMGIGQAYHNITSRMTIWGAGYKVRRITPLDPKTAVKEGAELVGESFVFTISGGWLLYEYNNSTTKARAADAAKRAAAAAERAELRTQLHAIDVRLVALETALERQWGANYRAPPEKKKVTIAAPLSPEDDPVVAGGATRADGANTVVTAKDTVVTQRQQQTRDENEAATQSTNNNNISWRRWIWPF